MALQDLLYEKKDGVAYVTINRPEKYNSLRPQTVEEMITVFEDAEKDPEVGVVVLGSTGKHFCVGGDIDEMKELSPRTGRLMFRRNVNLSSTMRNMGKPIVAAIKGYCLGVGNHLNLFSDLSIAADNTVFGQAGLKVATAPVWGGVQLLPKAVGDKKAREMIFLSRHYSAQQALEMGLCNEVVPLDQLESRVEAICRELLEMSPTALRISKLALNFNEDLNYPSFVNFGEMMSMMYGTEEFEEGMRAFKEKRSPNYKKFRWGEVRTCSTKP